MLSISAVTLKTIFAALLRLLDGLPIELSTVLALRPFICMTTLEDVAVKFAGVSTVIVRPESVTVEVAAELTVTVVLVAELGVAPPLQPVVVKD